MPGVVVTTAVRTGPTGANVAPASTFFLVGTAERGPINKATVVASIAEFEEVYGDYTSTATLHQHVRTYFEEGGTRVYVARIVGTGATAGTLTLVDGDDEDALTINAANPGSWSAQVSVAVVSSGGGFAVKVYHNDALKFSTGTVSNAATAADKINNSAVAARYVTATALAASAVLVPVAATELSAGGDGSSPTDSEWLGGLGLFDSSLGAGAVAIPGQYSVTFYDALIAHAVTNNRIALLGMDPTFTTSDAISAAAEYGVTAGAEHAAFYFPQVTVPIDGGVTITVSPESYVAAKRASAHQTVGPWQPGAGLLSQARFVTGLSQNGNTSYSIDKTTGDLLDDGRVNALRVIAGSVRIYGARSASDDESNYRYITMREMLNYIVTEAERSLEDLVFSPIDGRGTVFGRVEARLIGLLEPLRASGGLYEAFDADGNQIDPGYTVQVSDALNPVSQLAGGMVKARVGVRVSSVGDRIEVDVIKSNLTSSVV